MKKPINKFVVFLWVVAAIILIGGVLEIEATREMARDMARQGDTIHAVAGSFWRTIVLSLLPAVQLAAFGVLIELVDHIRWNMLHRG